MLTKVYRDGPSRQRLLKGFAVSGKAATKIVRDLLEQHGNRGRRDALPVRLYADEKLPKVLWLDTGAVWLHTPDARSEVFGHLALGANMLRDRIASMGGSLSFGAVFGDDEARGPDCGDEHLVETVSDVEREVCCNQFRQHTPTLIALAGRSAVIGGRIGTIASDRLSNSTRHYAARYFASVAPRHIDRVKRELRREEGVSRTDLLDIDPEGGPDDSSNGVRVRCLDAQMFMSTARAHAILCQALLVRSRSLVRAGRRVGNVPQAIIDRNRARAIASGLAARVEVEDSPSGGRGKTARYDDRQTVFRSAGSNAVRLVMSLQDELRVLEVGYGEISTLVLGLSLRTMGLAGIRNENDLVRAVRPDGARRGMDLGQLLEKIARGEATNGIDPVTSLNEGLFKEAAAQVRSWWEVFLRPRPTQRLAAVAGEARVSL